MQKVVRVMRRKFDKREQSERTQMKSYGILLMDKDQPSLSNCCDAEVRGNIGDDRIGICADCGEWAEFPEVDE